MSVNIHGKEYRTVAERINLFYERYSGLETIIKTEIIKDEGSIVQIKATIWVNDNSAEEGTVSLQGNGFAEEDRSKGRINSTSALENCETSAIGRALASIGLGGEEYASANEVENAVHQQKKVVVKDDGSQFPQVDKLVNKAMNKMNGNSHDIKDAVCNFTKHKGKMWSQVAGEDLDYIKWIMGSVKDLDNKTKSIISQFV